MKLILITGSSGFIGTNLVNKLLEDKNNAIIALDNFSASEKWKADLFKSNPNYEFFEYDICDTLSFINDNSTLLKKYGKIDEIYNLACPASPPRYRQLPLETINVCTTGFKNVLDLAVLFNSKVIHASTSEVYGDPLTHPQKEDYRGNVNTVGPRSCYDEGKRIAETIAYEYCQKYGLDIKLPRLFNTYGPYMDPMDGRVVTNFITWAIAGKPIKVYGDGKQTRSFQYIDDLLNAFSKLMAINGFMGPINLGNPVEFTVIDFAKLVIELTYSKSKIELVPLEGAYKDDPKQRKPDITLANKILNWQPEIKLREGVLRTIDFFKRQKID